MLKMLNTTKPVTLEISTGDGRKLEFGDSILQSIDVSQLAPETVDFETWAGDRGTLLTKQSSIVVDARFIVRGKTELFFDDEVLEENDMDHGEDYCRYCGSDWQPDRRGNCGACGGPKKFALSDD